MLISHDDARFICPVADSSFQPVSSHLRNCAINTSLFRISVVCLYSSNSVATGFQIMAQLQESSQVHKLYVNQTSSLLPNTTSVEVEENGLYQVAIFAIREAVGIVGSEVEHLEEVLATEGKDSHG